MVHAGVPPNWSQSEVINNAALVHSQLRNENLSEFLSQMYGNLPHTWSETLTIKEKCRYTINALMRMRFCKEDGELEFEHKLNVDKSPAGFKAWFLHKNRLMKEQKIFFGHWSSLKNVDTKNIYPLDHGCIWGGQLTAYNLTNNIYISQDSVEI
jgi:bis(5'-nucleosyl)-tetraphosphatase (symmetrical)